ncbi:hypothetical protein CR513_39428, partial [Mucuna pruriens]
MAAVLLVVQKWRHYLLGRPFALHKDQMSLKFLADQRGAAEMDLQAVGIKYNPGIENKEADTFSQRLQFSARVCQVCTEMAGYYLSCGGYGGRTGMETWELERTRPLECLDINTRRNILLLSFGASPPVLKPIIHISLRNLAMLAELSSDVLDLFLAGSPSPLIKYPLQKLKLHSRWSPPLPRSYFVPTRPQQWITIHISQSNP